MRVRKRLFDLAMVSGGMVVFAPVMTALATGIRLEDGGPVFFRQDRIGEGQGSFLIFKFRSMQCGEVTGMGRWIRKTGLDEIAQFLNILRGEMSLVGPRPLTAADLERLGWHGPEGAWRFEVKPGVTGMAQVFGQGARSSRALDQGYIADWSLRLDAELVAISFAMNVLGKSRVRQLLKAPSPAHFGRSSWPRPARRRLLRSVRHEHMHAGRCAPAPGTGSLHGWAPVM